MNTYRLAKWGRQRRPRRISKALWYKATSSAAEWWEVKANTIADARELCSRWPILVRNSLTGAIITLHGRNRT